MDLDSQRMKGMGLVLEVCHPPPSQVHSFCPTSKEVRELEFDLRLRRRQNYHKPVLHEIEAFEGDAVSSKLYFWAVKSMRCKLSMHHRLDQDINHRTCVRLLVNFL